MDKYTDPRLVLIHEGNKNSGRYPRGSGARPYQHEGLRFGKKKYVNDDGTLTPKGEARFELEKKRNAIKKKDNRVKDVEDLRDPDRWSKEDTERGKSVVDASSNLVKELRNIESSIKPKSQKFDLSEMTDADLRQQINRMQMEEQFSRLMNNREPEITRGREFLRETLDIAGKTLAVTSSALGIALAMKQLKGG